jgi:hypothetical protein
MIGAVRMGKKKKTDEPPQALPSGEGAGRAEKTEFSDVVKLREAFKLDLQMVALRLKMPMGELLERLAYQYVQTTLAMVGQGKPIQAPPPRPPAA